MFSNQKESVAVFSRFAFQDKTWNVFEPSANMRMKLLNLEPSLKIAVQDKPWNIETGHSLEIFIVFTSLKIGKVSFYFWLHFQTNTYSQERIRMVTGCPVYQGTRSWGMMGRALSNQECEVIDRGDWKISGT